jgi:hypothetical protein
MFWIGLVVGIVAETAVLAIVWMIAVQRAI